MELPAGIIFDNHRLASDIDTGELEIRHFWTTMIFRLQPNRDHFKEKGAAARLSRIKYRAVKYRYIKCL